MEKNLESHKDVTKIEMEEIDATLKMLRESFINAKDDEERSKWYEEIKKFHEELSRKSNEHREYAKETKEDAKEESSWGMWSTVIVTADSVALAVGGAVWASNSNFKPKV